VSVDIAYIVSHGFAARMVMQTNLLGKLVLEGNSVALICPDENDESLRAYCRKNNVQLVSFNESGKLSHQNYIFKRKYYLEDLEKNPALWEKHIYSVKYNRSRNPFSHIWPRYYGLVYWLIPYFPSIRKRFIKNEHKHLESKGAQALMDKLNPKKLVATYPINFNEATLLYYGNLRKETETWIHLLSWDNITCKGYFPQLAEKYIAWGPIMKDELKEFYHVSDEKIFECGVPHFDLHFDVKKSPAYHSFITNLKLDPARPYLFFAMSSPRFAPYEIEIVEWLAKLIAKGAMGGNMQLVIRPHPQNVTGNISDRGWLPRLDALTNISGVAVDYPDLVASKMAWSMEMKDMERLAQLITGSAMVLNSGSTISIDAILHDKPVLITSFDGDRQLPYWRSARRLMDYTHLKKLADTGGVVITRSYADLIDKIKHFIEAPRSNDKNIQRAKLAECGVNEDSTSLVVKTLSLC